MAHVPRSALDVLFEHLSPLDGRTVLDIGCGAGRLKSKFEQRGATWRGLDPYAPADAPEVLARAPAEAMPYEDDCFDGAYFLNSLHHVPTESMAAALSEAARVLKPGGPLVIIEPMAEGALSQALAVIDDETTIRAAAQLAMDKAVQSGVLEQLSAFRYERKETYASFEDFCASVESVAPERAAAVAAQRDAFRAAFETHGVQTDDGWALDQPMAARILRAPLE